MHAVIQTTVQRVVILGLQNGLRDSRILTNVFPQASVVVGITIVHIERPSHIPG